MGQGVQGSHYVNNGLSNFIIQKRNGKVSLAYTGLDPQYESIGFNLVPNKDMSQLVNAYELLFYVKGIEPTSFDLRFIDTKKTDTEDRPWRMNLRVNPNDLLWNGEWEEVHGYH